LQLAILRPGETQTIVGSGFVPGESVAGVVNSTPISLGTQVANADGVVTYIWISPADLSPGVHEVVLTGDRSGSVSGTFEVVPADVVAALIEALAQTGLSLVSLSAASVMFLITGMLVMIARRRRVIEIAH